MSGGGDALGTDGSEGFGSLQESEIVAKRRDLCRFSDQPVAEIVQCGEPAFARPTGELRLGRRVTVREGCLDVARVAGEVGPPQPHLESLPPEVGIGSRISAYKRA